MLCSQHFCEEELDRTGQTLHLRGRKDSVPSIFPNNPAYMQKVNVCFAVLYSADRYGNDVKSVTCREMLLTVHNEDLSIDVKKDIVLAVQAIAKFDVYRVYFPLITSNVYFSFLHSADRYGKEVKSITCRKIFYKDQTRVSMLRLSSHYSVLS